MQSGYSNDLSRELAFIVLTTRHCVRSTEKLP
jgi:hypothetical protein